MSLEGWLLLIATCMVGAMTPGPSLMLIMQSGLRHGRIHGLKTSCVHAVGVAIWAAFTVIGVSTLLVSSPVISTVFTALGASYLFYLGWQAIKTFRVGEVLVESVEQESSIPVSQGFSIAFLNPKLAVFFLALYSSFVTESLTTVDKFFMVAISGGVDALWYALVTVTITTSSMRTRLEPKLRYIELAAGILFIVVGCRALVSVIN